MFSLELCGRTSIQLAFSVMLVQVDIGQAQIALRCARRQSHRHKASAAEGRFGERRSDSVMPLHQAAILLPFWDAWQDTKFGLTPAPDGGLQFEQCACEATM